MLVLKNLIQWPILSFLMLVRVPIQSFKQLILPLLKIWGAHLIVSTNLAQKPSGEVEPIRRKNGTEKVIPAIGVEGGGNLKKIIKKSELFIVNKFNI